MQRTNVYLDEDQLHALKHLAAAQNRSVAAVVRQAVNVYLAEQFVEDAEWLERFDSLVERIQSRIPPDITPEEIEADITVVSEERRRERIAARGR